MQRFEENRPVTPPLSDMTLDSIEEGEFCETTSRIVIISPFPASVRSLVMALTIRCYDVLVFHHENDPVLPTLQSDLMIIDRTKGIPAHTFQMDAGKQTRMLFLQSDPSKNGSEPVQDVLIWPCAIEQALVKIKEMTSGSGTSVAETGDKLRIKDVILDLKRFAVHKAGTKVELTRTEFDLLRVLLANDGGVLSRQEIMEQVWGDTYFGGSNSVDVHIKSLRQKLGDDPKNPRYITTVRGIGYRIAD